jgi:midasin
VAKRAAIESEIRDLVKLASWKDVTVIGLTNSAHRTHRRLHKCIRKYRSILNESALPFLMSNEPVDLHGIHTEGVERLSYLSGIAASDGGNPRGSLLERFKYFWESRIFPVALSAAPISLLENFTRVVISTAQELSQQALQVSKGKVQSRKTLLAQKRRAWVDFLKDLKSMGVSSYIKSDVDDKVRDDLWMLERVPLPDTLPSDSDIYFCRAMTELRYLDAAMSDHNPDLSTRELQRARNSVVNMIAKGYTVRSWQVLHSDL